MSRPRRKLRVWNYPWTTERAYTRANLAYVKTITDTVTAMCEQAIPAIVARRSMFKTDAIGDGEIPPDEMGAYLANVNYATMTQRLIDNIKSRILDGSRVMGLKVKTYADQVNAFNFKQWNLMQADIDKKFGKGTVEALENKLAAERGVREAMTGSDIAKVRAAMSVNVLTPESLITEELAAFETTNLALIKSIPEQYLPQLQNRIIVAVRKGENYQGVMAEIKESYNLPEWRARLIARDQIGKLNGDLTRIRQQGLGLNDYFWRGVLDSRERPAHVEREGEKFSYDKPPDDGNPGQPIQCRCWAEPDIEAAL